MVMPVDWELFDFSTTVAYNVFRLPNPRTQLREGPYGSEAGGTVLDAVLGQLFKFTQGEY